MFASCNDIVEFPAIIMGLVHIILIKCYLGGIPFALRIKYTPPFISFPYTLIATVTKLSQNSFVIGFISHYTARDRLIFESKSLVMHLITIIGIISASLFIFFVGTSFYVKRKHRNN